jgi:hypothetical protein
VKASVRSKRLMCFMWGVLAKVRNDRGEGLSKYVKKGKEVALTALACAPRYKAKDL